MDDAFQEAPGPAVPGGDRLLIGEVGQRFPGWSAWRSDTFRWWAYRTASTPLTIGQLRAGCRLLVQADTFAELCSAIGEEIDFAGRVAPTASLSGPVRHDTACI